ncbi:MAG: histidine kinase [bacterium]|nr:histidine kinase [bacterium]
MEHRPRTAESTGLQARLEVELARHRHTEEELRQSGERFRLLIEHGREFVFRYCFPLQRFEYISPGIADLCGYSAAEFCDNPQLILDIVHADDRLLLQQYIDAGDFSSPVALRCLRRDGSVIWLEQRALPSYDAHGQLLVLEGIVRDVSNYRHLLEDSEYDSASAAERERMLTDLRRIGSATLESLELDHVLDTMAQQVVHAGILRSLMVAVVDHRNHVICVARNYLSFEGRYKDGIGRVRPGADIIESPTVSRREGGRLVFSDQRIIGTTYDLDDDNITPTVARTGQLTVIDGADRRFDERFEHVDDNVRAATVSYFIPIKRDGRVLAVLATGSSQTDRAETLRRIEAMAPLLEQVAVALDHATVHGHMRDHARELHALNGRLRHEVSRRLQAEAALRDFSQRTVRLAEEERRRVARELHDGVNQYLCAAGFRLEAAASETEEGVRVNLDHTRDLLDRTINEVRRISQDLRPGVLDDLGLAPAVRSLCEGFTLRTGHAVAHDLTGIPQDLPAEVAITAYRLLQESLNHWSLPDGSTGIQIAIEQSQDGALLCTVIGPTSASAAIPAEVVRNLNERAGLLRGSVTVETTPEPGLQVLICLPSRAEPEFEELV